MKPAQLIALLVTAVVLVFIVTFASMHVGTKGKNKEGEEISGDGNQPAPVQLRFYERLGGPKQGEFNLTGHHDFWFENPNAEEVTIGLQGKGCTCNDAILYLVSAEQLAPLLRAWAPLFGESAAGPGACLARGLLIEEAREALASKVSPVRSLEKDGPGARVPPRATGFVRITWERRKDPRVAADNPQSRAIVENQLFFAEIWAQDQKKGGTTRLEARVLLSDAIRVDAPERINVPTLNPGDDPRVIEILCWSSTRPAFTLTTRKDNEFIEPSTPIPLTQSERVKLEHYGGQVLCGYKVIVRVHEHLEGGKLFDQGPYVRQVELLPEVPGLTLEPIRFLLLGEVRGDVTIGKNGRIDLETFSVSEGTKKQVHIVSPRKDRKLSVVRVPSFLKARLEDGTQEEGKRTWTLHVEVPPDGISGRFPRDASPELRDSAIYLRVEGGRQIRVPVAGDARR